MQTKATDDEISQAIKDYKKKGYSWIEIGILVFINFYHGKFRILKNQFDLIFS